MYLLDLAREFEEMLTAKQHAHLGGIILKKAVTLPKQPPKPGQLPPPNT